MPPEFVATRFLDSKTGRRRPEKSGERVLSLHVPSFLNCRRPNRLRDRQAHA
jgi:hypothetical protein